MSAVCRGSSVPRYRIGSRRIFGACRRAVDEELHAGDSDVVGRGCRNGGGAGNGTTACRSGDAQVGVVASPLLTVTVTGADVFWFPAASRARAVKLWDPFVAVDVVQLIE